MVAVEIQGLIVEVDGYRIIDNLDLIVEEGEEVRISGDLRDAEILLDILSGLTLPNSGEIWIYNTPPRQALQRGLIYYTDQTPSPPHPIPVLLTSQSTVPYNPNVTVHPSSIGIFNETIEKSYRLRIKKQKEGGNYT